MTNRLISSQFCLEFLRQEDKSSGKELVNGLTAVALNSDVLSDIEKGDIWRVKLIGEDLENRVASVQVKTLVDSADGLHHLADLYPLEYFPALRRQEKNLREIAEKHGVLSYEYAKRCIQTASSLDQLPLHYVDSKLMKAIDVLRTIDAPMIELCEPLYLMGRLALQSGSKRIARTMFQHLYVCAKIEKSDHWKQIAVQELELVHIAPGSFGRFGNKNTKTVTIDVQPASSLPVAARD